MSAPTTTRPTAPATAPQPRSVAVEVTEHPTWCARIGCEATAYDGGAYVETTHMRDVGQVGRHAVYIAAFTATGGTDETVIGVDRVPEADEVEVLTPDQAVELAEHLHHAAVLVRRDQTTCQPCG